MTLLNLGSGSHPLPGFHNLDLPSWRWGDALPYADSTVDGISVSHALMYAEERLWPFIFAEFARVLVPGGVVRITEDATDDYRSCRYGGFEGAETLTSFIKVAKHLEQAGLKPAYVSSMSGNLDALRQQWHGDEPKVFFIEGVKR